MIRSLLNFSCETGGSYRTQRVRSIHLRRIAGFGEDDLVDMLSPVQKWDRMNWAEERITLPKARAQSEAGTPSEFMNA